MDNLKLSKALEILMPLGGYSLAEGIVTIHEDGIAHGYTVPTDDEINTAGLQVDANNYKQQRINEYPSVGDQLDALWKGGAEAAAMKVNIIDAIKAKYPK